MARRIALPLAALGLAGPLVLLLSSAAGASVPATGATSGTATVRLAADAWYSASSACTSSPTGCLPAGAPAPPYPAKTLHVGVAAGQEESRTYLSLDLAALPAGTALSGGVLKLPVAGPDDGSRAADTATLRACLVTASFKDATEGATDAPPAIDCKTSSPAKHVAAAGNEPEMFTVDLTAFASSWAGGALNQGLVLVPAEDTAPNAMWHVAMSAHDRTGSTVAAPTAVVQYASAAAAGDDFDTSDVAPAAPTDSTGSSSVSFAAAPLAPQPDTTPVVPAPAVQPEVAPQASPVAPVQQLTPQAFVGGGGFAYPGVFLLPIVIAAAGAMLARALTRDLATA
jgi:hypothetical protein